MSLSVTRYSSTFGINKERGIEVITKSIETLHCIKLIHRPKYFIVVKGLIDVSIIMVWRLLFSSSAHTRSHSPIHFIRQWISSDSAWKVKNK